MINQAHETTRETSGPLGRPYRQDLHLSDKGQSPRPGRALQPSGPCG